MGTKIYKSSSLEKCLETASEELKIGIKDLKYTILEEKRRFLSRTITISVDFEEKVTKDDKEPELITNDGSVSVVDGKIIVKNPKNNGKPAFITPSKHVKLFVDGNEVDSRREVYEENKIEVNFDENQASRIMNLSTAADGMELYISITFVPQLIYSLKDVESGKSAVLDAVLKEKKYPELYKKEEIKQELEKKGIAYGIIEENLDKCTQSREIDNILIARGKTVTEGKDDQIKLYLGMENGTTTLKTDKKGNVDFKSIGTVEAVRAGEVIAERIPGGPGEDGKDIYGNVRKCKPYKAIKLKISDGCTLENDNIVKATIDGKPCVKGNSFCVYKVHEVHGDVNLTTGNIKFIGDVKIDGNVEEGMQVEAGNMVEISGNVESAKIISKGNIIIKNNVISSQVICGFEDANSIKLIEFIENLKSSIEGIIDNTKQVKEQNLIEHSTTDGQIIKLLIENKFKKVIFDCLNIDKYISLSDKQDNESFAKLLDLIKNKLVGLAPVKIKDVSELDEVVTISQICLEELKDSLLIPVDIELGYCQDSVIESSGNVTFTGKGEYVSEVSANNIYFSELNSVVRGGILKAKGEIKCSNIGSLGGAKTKVIVGKSGHIWANVAYQNTTFVVGERKLTVDSPIRDIHAFLDESGELILESLKL